ncbi:uncharacterized protein NPIL_259931 [Nephila pilipes]|uniref:Gustatory receptor n=1 Tax=Nephila pilipes TaxID=299642 RepID=A0A8X6IYB0_NEPPI|nr:uncharacterized protein NPIL_259931 [Nephila pilipes]
MKTQFGLLFTIARISGLPLYPSYPALSTKFMRVFYWTINILRISSLLYSCVSICVLLSAVTLRITYLSFNIFGAVVAFVIVSKRHKIRKVVATLIQLSLELNHDSFVGSRYSTPIGALLGVLVAIIAVSQIVFFTKRNLDSRWKVITIFGTPLSNHTRRIFFDIHHFAIIFTYTNSAAIVGISSLIIFNIYTAMDNITKRYHKRIQEMLNKIPIVSDDIFANISFFRRIFDCIREVEEAVALSTLFLYGASITWIFSSFNVVILQGSAYKNIVAYGFVGVTCLMALVVILMLTISASNIVLRDKALKRSLVHFAEKPFKFGVLPPHHVFHFTLMHQINLLSQLIREYKFQLTGGHMFVIRRGLILTGIGIIFSYGVVIDQLKND